MNELRNSNSKQDMFDLLEKDAKEALSLMYTIFVTELNKIDDK